VSVSPLPRTKTARRERIAELIASRVIHSQAELADLLTREGITVTQGTLSRDLDEIGAIKVRDAEGFLAYALPSGDGHGDIAAHRLEERIAEFVLAVDRSGDLVIVRTPPGGAQLLASSLDRFATVSGASSFLGTVAGDDTILVIAREGLGEHVTRIIRGIAEGLNSSSDLNAKMKAPGVGQKQGRVRK
jgi:transcriptional regulator of arginine metabolism